jgi:hypothetical protein
LQDWCQWIVDEVRHASISMARAMRPRGVDTSAGRFRKPRSNNRYPPSARSSIYSVEMDLGARQRGCPRQADS